MSFVVSLQDVVDEIDMQADGCAAYLNRHTGQLYTLQDEEIELIEDDVDLEEIPEWQRDSLGLIRDILESDNWLPLPTKFDVHEWSIMDDFARSIENADLSEELQSTIRGAGAFRHFKAAIYRHGIEESWYRHKTAALEAIAIDWLDKQQISYVRDEGSDSSPQAHVPLTEPK